MQKNKNALVAYNFWFEDHYVPKIEKYCHHLGKAETSRNCFPLAFL